MRPPDPDSQSIAETLAEAVRQSPQGLDTHTLAQSLAQTLSPTQERLATALQAAREQNLLLSFAGHWLTPEQTRHYLEALAQALLTLHAEKPKALFVPAQLALAKAQIPLAGKPAARLLAHAAAQNLLRLAPEDPLKPGLPPIAHADHRPDLPARQRALLDRALAALDQTHPNPANPYELHKILNIPPQAAQEIIRLGVQTGEILALDETVFYTPAAIEKIADHARQIFQNQPFTPAEFRDAVQTSRKYAVPLLEHLAKTLQTYRQEDPRTGELLHRFVT